MDDTSEPLSPEVSEELPKIIELLETGAKVHAIVVKINEIIEKFNNLELKAPKIKTCSLESERVMNDDDARRVSMGDLKHESHKDAAKLLGLSYGQVYSSRKGFTFKNIYQENLKAQ